MKEPYTTVIKHSGAWWIGWIEEVPGVHCQEGTTEELLETLRTTLREAGFLARWTPTSRPNPFLNICP